MNRLDMRGTAHYYYLWKYASHTNVYEDISHGGIDVDFLVLAFKYGLTINSVHLLRITNTFRLRMIKDSNYNMAWRVSGEADGPYDQAFANKRCGYWLDLARYSSVVYKACSRHFEKGVHTGKGLAYVKMLIWKSKQTLNPFSELQREGISIDL